jgi:hypothetical protein
MQREAGQMLDGQHQGIDQDGQSQTHTPSRRQDRMAKADN